MSILSIIKCWVLAYRSYHKSWLLLLKVYAVWDQIFKNCGETCATDSSIIGTGIKTHQIMHIPTVGTSNVFTCDTQKSLLTCSLGCFTHLLHNQPESTRTIMGHSVRYLGFKSPSSSPNHTLICQKLLGFEGLWSVGVRRSMWSILMKQ